MANAYEEIVQRNLAHMGTTAADWRACPVEIVQTDGGPAPDTDLPAGYAPAPSMIPDCAGAIGTCPCLLCGHAIRNCYWLQCDSKRWVLRVGNECVTHFSERSGLELAKDAELERAARAIEAVRKLTHLDYVNERGGYYARSWAKRLLGKGALTTPGAQRTWWRNTQRGLDKTVQSMRDYAAKQPYYAAPLTRLANTLAEL